MNVPEWVRNNLGQSVVLRTAQGSEHGRGRLIAYADRPTVIIVRPDGSRDSWIAALAEPLRCELLCCDVVVPHPPSWPGCSSSPLLWAGDQV